MLDCHTLDEYAKFIKSKGGSEDRRSYLKRAFGPANAFVHNISATPGDDVISEILSKREYLTNTWEKALQRRATDPDGSITLARTLLESTFKQILDEKGDKMGFSYTKDTTFTELYAMASKVLCVHPTSTTDPQFKKMLGACSSFVTALGDLRNSQGDAHGKSQSDIKPEKRIAELSVNLAGSIASFFILTLEESST
jgi:hypothetical protein